MNRNIDKNLMNALIQMNLIREGELPKKSWSNLKEEINLDEPMKIGDKVQHLKTGDIGTVHYSSFGFSIHMWTEHEGQRCLAKTQGDRTEELLKYWKVIDREDVNDANDS